MLRVCASTTVKLASDTSVPAGEMPGLMMALGAAYVLRGASGERRAPAREYYLSPYETAAEPGEVLAAIRIPAPPVGHGWAYEKLKRKVGDYATAAERLTQAIAREDRNWQLYYLRSRVEKEAGNATAARADLERARQLNPRAPELQAGSG